MNYKGLAYPIKLGQKGLFRSANNIQLIEGNIIQILGTRKGERVMLPEFGTNIHKFIHEPLDHITCALIRVEIFDAIKRWEPRVILDKTNSNIIPYSEEFRVQANLRYMLKTYNQNRNLVLEINRKDGVKTWQD